jgi:hypothetical protein
MTDDAMAPSDAAERTPKPYADGRFPLNPNTSPTEIIMQPQWPSEQDIKP